MYEILSELNFNFGYQHLLMPRHYFLYLTNSKSYVHKSEQNAINLSCLGEVNFIIQGFTLKLIFF